MLPRRQPLFIFVRELWLARLVVAGAAGRSCPGDPDVLGAEDEADRDIKFCIHVRYKSAARDWNPL